jgi:hypothetical protein
MHIEFSAGETGFFEARELRAMVRYIERNTVTGSFDPPLLAQLMTAAEQHMARPEFAERLAANATEQPDERPLLRRLRGLWREITGPSVREEELGRQRIDALDRADHAERATFAALAEAARNAEERDATMGRVRELEQQLEALRRHLESSSR